MREEERYFFEGPQLQHMPEEAVLRLLPTAKLIVRDFQDAVMEANLRLRVGLVSLGEEEQQRAEKLVRWLTALWDSLSWRDILDEAVWYMLVRGVAVCQVLYDPSELRERPSPPPQPPELPNLGDPRVAQEYAEMQAEYEEAMESYWRELAEWEAHRGEARPLEVVALDPITVSWEPLKRPRYVVVEYERTLAEVQRRWGVTLEGEKPTARVRWLEYWDDRYFAYWIERGTGSDDGGLPAPGLTPGLTQGQLRGSRRRLVKGPTPHGLGALPFVIASPWPTPSRSPYERYLGIYRYLGDMLRWQQELHSQRATLLQKLGWPALTVKTAVPRSIRLNLRPLQPNIIYPEDDISFLIPPLPEAFIETSFQWADNLIARVAPVGLLQQLRARSGQQQALLMAAARLPLLRIKLALEKLVQEASALCLKAVERGLRQPVFVAGFQNDDPLVVELSPGDVRGHYRVKATLMSSLFGDQAVNLPTVLQMLGARLISRLTAARMLDIASPEEEQERILYEEIRELPVIKAKLAEKALEEIDPALAKEVLEELQAATRGQQGMAGGLGLNVNVQAGPGQMGRAPRTPRSAQLRSLNRAGQARRARAQQQVVSLPVPLSEGE